ncbi:MAG TPA: cyclic nucleotide-binding domain-containing protein, partial [Candidatus Hydrogenedentes bacterium]|nr:cyclic nucleotide-binding domain-containing protein [Candidatus Hydrogenedentota bacterium]
MFEDAKYKRYAEKIRIFNGLIPEEVESIIRQGKVLFFREGQAIFHEGQLGSNLFVVLSGKIGIFNRSKMIAQLGVGDTFGEMAVLTHRPRTVREHRHLTERIAHAQ